MSDIDLDAIADFMSAHARALAWIIRDADGLWQLEDLPGELLILLRDMQDAEARPFDLACEQDAGLVLRVLRRRARRNGQITRRSARPDQAGSGDDWRPGVPSWEHIAADDGAHPQSLLEAMESPTFEPEPIDPYHSELAAWQWLLDHIGRRTIDLASFLLISPSWCRRCRHRARQRAGTQHSLPPPPLGFAGDAQAVRPWRRFKLPPRDSVAGPQPALDFWSRPAQPGQGQLWLL